MGGRHRLGVLLAVTSPGWFAGVATGSDAVPPRPPNVVLIVADDHGYADWGPAAREQGFETPNLDRMAAEGVFLSSFYAAPTCSPTRASILTGSYPHRVGIPLPLVPGMPEALHPDEITVAEVLRDAGYSTALVGKWHLGDRPDVLPTGQGFDEYFGLPSAHDLGPVVGGLFPDARPAPLLDGDTVVVPEPDPAQLTTRYSERAVDFIDRHRHQPFFLFLSHSMPHVPLAVSDRFAGTTASLYGDVVAEIDWSVGQVLDQLERSAIDDDTLVIFVSDNGPSLWYGDHQGSAAPLRGGKGTAFEGGVRVPFIARWPGRLPGGAVIDEPAMAIDLLPTFAGLAGGQLPTDRVIDGVDIWPLLTGAPDASAPHDVVYYYVADQLHAVRQGRWKLHLPHSYNEVETPGHGGEFGEIRVDRISLSLFDLEADIGETTDVSAEHPDVVAQLLHQAGWARLLLGDSLTGHEVRSRRPPALPEPQSP